MQTYMFGLTILILVAYVKSKKRCHIFVENLSDILQNKNICHIASCRIFIIEEADNSH